MGLHQVSIWYYINSFKHCFTLKFLLYFFLVCHAAINAILSKNAENLDGCTVYTTLFPGHEDAKMIIQSGIKKVVYYPSPDEVKKAYTKIAKDLLKRANVKFVR